jgi:hypothetical protein
MKRTAIVAAAVAAVLLLPACASASTLGIGAGAVAQYTGAASEANHLVITYDWAHADYVFTDTGASAIAITGYKSPCHNFSAHVAFCPWGSFNSISVQLGNGGSYGESQLSYTPVTLHAGTGDDTLIGGGGHDTLIAGAGRDTLTAGHGDTTLVGGTGPSTLTGGPGHDAFNGGSGGETINSRDGVAENVACGAGDDTAIVDPNDTVSGDCEYVDNGITAPSGTTPVAGTAPGTPGSAGTAGPLAAVAQVVAKAAQVTSKEVLPLKVACPASVTGGCRGTLTVTIDLGSSKGKAVAARRRKLVLTRRKTFAIAAGKEATVRVPLDRRAVRIFRRKGRVSRTRRFKAVVTLATRTEAGTATSSRTIVVHAARRRPTPQSRKRGRR